MRGKEKERLKKRGKKREVVEERNCKEKSTRKEKRKITVISPIVGIPVLFAKNIFLLKNEYETPS